MTIYSKRLAELQYKDAVKEKLGRHRNKSTQISRQTGENIEQKLTSSLQYIEGLDELPFRVARLPLWPTQEHIEGMLNARILVQENPFTGYLKPDVLVQKNLFVWEDIPRQHFSQPNISQVIWYQIPSKEVLGKVIFDEEVLAIFEDGELPIVYGMNHEAHSAYAKYLGWKIPTQEQQLAIWNALPGEDDFAKAKHASIPFYGDFLFALYKNNNRTLPTELLLRSSTPDNSGVHIKNKSITIWRNNTFQESSLPLSCFSTAFIVFNK